MALFLCFVAIFFYFSRNKLKAKRLRGDARGLYQNKLNFTQNINERTKSIHHFFKRI